MKIQNIARLLVVLAVCTLTQIVFAQDTSYYYEQPKEAIVKTDYSGVIIGTQRLSERVAYPEANDFYAISIVVNDTTWDKAGNVLAITAKDYVVHMSKTWYDKFVAYRGVCYVHAKWTIKTREGYYTGTKAPKNPNRPRRKMLLVYGFGDVLTDGGFEDDYYGYDYIATPEEVKQPEQPAVVPKTETKEETPKTVLPCTKKCPQGKKLNIKTCKCEAG